MKVLRLFAGVQRPGYDAAEPERLFDYLATRIKEGRMQVNAIELCPATDDALNSRRRSEGLISIRNAPQGCEKHFYRLDR